MIVPIYKRKGSSKQCDNYRGVSLLSTAGKVLCRLIANRIRLTGGKILAESQCGFRSNRGCNAIFSVRQLQEKCKEQRLPLHTCFVDLRKAYDSVDRKLLWQILLIYCFPPNICKLILAFHTHTNAQVSIQGKTTPPFEISHGLRQGCTLAPTLFNIFFNHMILATMKSAPGDIYLRYNIANKQLFRTRYTQKAPRLEIHNTLYADDAAVFTHKPEVLQHIMAKFGQVAQASGIEIN